MTAQGEQEYPSHLSLAKHNPRAEQLCLGLLLQGVIPIFKRAQKGLLTTQAAEGTTHAHPKILVGCGVALHKS